MHIAIEKRDPALLELLLVKCPKAANAPMYNDNRPLHSAATLSGVTDAQQLELVNILLKHGADKALRNKANKLPIELVQQDRDRVMHSRFLSYFQLALNSFIVVTTRLVHPYLNQKLFFVF